MKWIDGLKTGDPVIVYMKSSGEYLTNEVHELSSTEVVTGNELGIMRFYRSTLKSTHAGIPAHLIEPSEANLKKYRNVLNCNLMQMKINTAINTFNSKLKNKLSGDALNDVAFMIGNYEGYVPNDLDPFEIYLLVTTVSPRDVVKFHKDETVKSLIGRGYVTVDREGR